VEVTLLLPALEVRPGLGEELTVAARRWSEVVDETRRIDSRMISAVGRRMTVTVFVLCVVTIRSGADGQDSDHYRLAARAGAGCGSTDGGGPTQLCNAARMRPKLPLAPGNATVSRASNASSLAAGPNPEREPARGSSRLLPSTRSLATRLQAPASLALLLAAVEAAIHEVITTLAACIRGQQ
jgi:hypothetical protein